MASPIKRAGIEFINHTKSSIPSLLRKHSKLSSLEIKQIAAASHVYPFRANNYVINNLIDWNKVPNDPIFKLTFPQSDMLLNQDMERILNLMDKSSSSSSSNEINRDAIRREAISIRRDLNPHPAGQKEMNVPSVEGKRVPGVQHKYRETLLFFPSEQQFKSKDVSMLIEYIKENKQLTDILFTGGDPAVMKTRIWAKYLEPLIDEKNAKDLEHLNTIRIGTKSLTYWPYRYTHNDDSDEFLKLLERCSLAGKHVTIQAQFTHPQELQTKQIEDAIRRLRMTGANIRSQAPIVKGINDDSKIWSEMWKKQISLGIIPYYMFIERDTGPQHYFELPLVRAYQIFKDAVSRVSGIARTVRGPSMSCEPGKVAIMGIINDMMILQFLQSRNPEWMKNPFLAKLDPTATWLDDLKPYDGNTKSFFFQKELDNMINAGMSSYQMNDNIHEQFKKHENNQLQISKPLRISKMLNGNALKRSNGIKNGRNGQNGQQQKINLLIVPQENDKYNKLEISKSK